jgi:alpha-mannosidase
LKAELARRAAAFNQPLLAATVPYDAHGGAPLEWGLYKDEEIGTGIVTSGLKLGEKSDQLLIRMYEGTGVQETFATGLSGAPKSVSNVNFLEDDMGTAPCMSGKVELTLRPFEIRSIAFNPQKWPTAP